MHVQKKRLAAAGVHLCISLLVALLAAGLVFGLWYPGDFTWLAGGRDLFLLVTSVDVVLGPLLTLAVFSPAKARRELWVDLSLIGVVQAAALAYGLHTVYVARPVAMVFEVDRIRLVAANDVAEADLAITPVPFRKLPMSGPVLFGTRKPTAGNERNDALFQGLAGHDIGSRPQFWQTYEASKPEALAKSRPIEVLIKHYPERAAELRGLLERMSVSESDGRFLPVMARGAACAAVLDGAGQVVGYFPVDGFI